MCSIARLALTFFMLVPSAADQAAGQTAPFVSPVPGLRPALLLNLTPPFTRRPAQHARP